MVNPELCTRGGGGGGGGGTPPKKPGGGGGGEGVLPYKSDRVLVGHFQEHP